MDQLVQFRKLEPEEAEKLVKNKGQMSERAQIAEVYKMNLRVLYQPGDWGEVVIPEGQKKITVKNRLNAAAKSLGIQLSYRRTNDDRVLFQVVKQEEMNLEPSGT